MAKKNIFWKSGNPVFMPSKDLNIDYKDFRSVYYYKFHSPEITDIILSTLDEENWAYERVGIYSTQLKERASQNIHYITKVDPQLLPSTYLERFWQHIGNATQEMYENEIKRVEELIKKILKNGYDETKPVWVIDKLFTSKEPPIRQILLDGGHHRLQSIRQMIFKKLLPKDFKIPTLITLEVPRIKLPKLKPER
jgi:hypothetical protein